MAAELKESIAARQCVDAPGNVLHTAVFVLSLRRRTAQFANAGIERAFTSSVVWRFIHLTGSFVN